jgi:predicted transcriptional regulator
MYDTYIMKRTQIYLETEQDRKLAGRATAAGTTKSNLIREAIEQYLASPDDDAARLAEFRAAIDEFARAPGTLPDGRSYVEEMRARDRRREREIERRRG